MLLPDKGSRVRSPGQAKQCWAFFSFRKFLSGSTESGIVPSIWQKAHHLLYGTYKTSETHTTASTDPHRTDRIMSNAYMRCVLMTSYGIESTKTS
ncbi:hypothetical protein SFRURICE_006350 [Spodoptera frugiperda]|nr:hypothetical protein SFRURICE_006350 [Spodoptera frugiperda]